MHFKFKYIQKIVGGFFLTACVIIIILLVLVARGQKWFQQYARYVTYFNNGGGLHVGSSVMIQGLEAGKVARVRIEADNRVKVDVNIFKQYASHIREESIAKLTQPMIGSSRLEIVLGPQDKALIRTGGVIPSKEVVGADLDALINETTELIKKLKNPDEDLMHILSNVNHATKEISSSLTKKSGSLAMLIEERKLYDELLSTTTHLDSVLSGIDESTPDIRDAITEARRGLKETNKVILALQKSIFLRGNIERHLKQDSTLRLEGRAD